MTATLDGTAPWQHGLDSLHARLSHNAATRRRSHLDDAETVRDILSRIPNGRREIAALCADLCAGMKITQAEARRLIERARLLDRENVLQAAHTDDLSPEHLTAIERTIAAA